MIQNLMRKVESIIIRKDLVPNGKQLINRYNDSKKVIKCLHQYYTENKNNSYILEALELS